MPFANWKGASAGMIVSHITVLTITFGHLTIDNSVEFLETSIDGCTNDSFSSGIVKPSSAMFLQLSQYRPIEVSSYIDRQLNLETTTAAPTQDLSQFPQNVFAVSYMYYSLFGTLITVFVGMAVSLLTQSEADSYDSKFVHPVVYKMAKWFPDAGKLFTDERLTTEIKNSPLKEPREQHFNEAFDTKSEIIKENDTSNFKSNIIYKNDDCVEKYKKLSEE